ncbi:MAG TPA: GIY-YIG nuclease family protein [Paenisporosarcina sp.]|nr:GIY-YIG nuclease family protein [Paenisporosarcina sp.]
MMNKNCGIYIITNTANNKVYVGQSRSLSKRLPDHKNKLRKNIHHNSHLQNAWMAYGEENFTFNVIEYCELEELNNRERHWILDYKSSDRRIGYNITSPSENMETMMTSDETKLKISEAHIEFELDELISYLQDFYYMEGRVPVQRDLIAQKLGEYPSYAAYVKRFGSFKNALIEADLYDFVENKKLFNRKEYTKEEIISSFSLFIKNNGRFPLAIATKETSKSGLPSTTVVVKHFKSIEELKCLLGFSKEATIIKENEDAIIALKRLYDEQGFVESRTIDKSRITKSVRFYSNRFGTLYNAYTLAGIDLEENLQRSNEHKKRIKAS